MLGIVVGGADRGINLKSGGTLMLGRNSSLRWRLAIAALSLIARCGAASAQGASPPPAVSVTPVMSRQVTETGAFSGRVTAIDKVDIVARVGGFIEEVICVDGK